MDKHVQRERDNDRRRILEQELGQEEKLLAQARRDLSEQQRIRVESSAGQYTADPIQRRIKLHEDNVANLRREISKIR